MQADGFPGYRFAHPGYGTLPLPDGQITDFVSSPFRKNIPISSQPKSLHLSLPSRPT
jgi:hypothetical protein